MNPVPLELYNQNCGMVVERGLLVSLALAGQPSRSLLAPPRSQASAKATRLAEYKRGILDSGAGGGQAGSAPMAGSQAHTATALLPFGALMCVCVWVGGWVCSPPLIAHRSSPPLSFPLLRKKSMTLLAAPLLPAWSWLPCREYSSLS
jgi:hypothetical protein